MKSSLMAKMILLIAFLAFSYGCSTTRSFEQPSQPDAPAEVAKVSVIQSISFVEEENYTRIRIEGSNPIAAPFYKLLSDPLEISIDVPSIDLNQIKQPIRVDNGTISEIRTTQYDDKGRIEIGLVQTVNYNIAKEDKSLVIDVEKLKKSADTAEIKNEEERPKESEASPSPPSKEEVLPTVPVVTAPPSESAPKPPETAQRAKEILNFLPQNKGDFLALDIIADGKIENYNFFKLDSPARLVLDIWEVDTRFPKKSIKVKNSFIREIRVGHHPGKVRLVFDSLKPQLPAYQINRMGDRLIVSIGNVPPSSEPQVSETPKKVVSNITPSATMKDAPVEIKKEDVKKDDVKREEEKLLPQPKEEEKSSTETGAKSTPPGPVVKAATLEKGTEGKSAPEEALLEKGYAGRKLSLDFKDADIKNILRLIAEVSNLNIIAGDDVTGKVTMRLVDVPWDQALEVILQARSLGMSRAGNVIRVAPMTKLKKEVEEELTAKRAKEKLEDLVTELLPVSYATAKEILPQVKGVLSDRGDIKVDERTNILIVKDISRNILGAKNLVKSLDTKTPQVIIEARIVEANLVFQNDLGVQWGFLASAGKDGKRNTLIGGGVPGASQLTGSLINKVVDLPATPSVGTPGVLELLFTSKYGLRELDVAISAHENQGNVKIISSPKIATLDNKEASIEQGLRIPYLKLTTEGTVTTDFIDANIKLTVVPHVTNDGNIKLNIKAKKDAPDQSITVQGVPSIDKKEAITEVMVKDNGIFVIAGIYTIQKTESEEGIPLFSKIPLLGWLFKKESKGDTRKDLMIFISPKIIRDQV